jgi:hypothetical protein
MEIVKRVRKKSVKDIQIFRDKSKNWMEGIMKRGKEKN